MGAGVIPQNVPLYPDLGGLDLELGLDIPAAIPKDQTPVVATSPVPLPGDTTELLRLAVRMLQRIDVDLSPDNYQNQLKYLTAQVQVGTQYDYPIPTWTRRFLLTNRSANAAATTNGGNLYYWFNGPGPGNKTLPQNYRTLTAGQSVSEFSNYDAPISGNVPVISLFADSTCTDQGWELAFIGWYGVLYNPLPSE
jgi:hypothetical protein